MQRRDVLRGGLALFAATAARALGGCTGSGSSSATSSSSSSSSSGGAMDAGPPTRVVSRIAEIGFLQEPDANGLRLPEGFTSRIIAESGVVVPNSAYTWHAAPDGGATFATPEGGWIYVSNSELPVSGGAGAVKFDAEGNFLDAYPILENTFVNCAGGATPWGTWLSCEETAWGRVWECDPFGREPARELPNLGLFQHEAAAIDLQRRHVYLSEDQPDGRLYRFVSAGLTPSGRMDLDNGELQVAVVDMDGAVTWVAVPDPVQANNVATRQQVAESTVFRGGEGLWFFEDKVFLSTKGDNRVWQLDVPTQRMTVLYDRSTHPTPFISGVDNLVVSASGDVLVAEDGGDMEIAAITPQGFLVSLLKVEGHAQSEICGPAFDPSGTRLYFSSQRGRTGRSANGVTYEVTGPFHARVPA